MSTTSSAFDSKLRELELEASLSTNQMDQHWRLLRDQLHPPAATANKPFFKNPYVFGVAITICTVGVLIFFKSTRTTDIPSSSIPTADSTWLPTNENVILQDTLPTKKVVTRTTKKYPVKRVSTGSIKKDSITVEPSPKKLPVKKPFGVTTRSTPTNKKDTIKLEPFLIDEKTLVDTIHLTPIKKDINSPTSGFFTTTQGIAIAPVNMVTEFAYTSVNHRGPTIINEVNLDTKTNSHYVIYEDSNRFQNLEQVLQEPYFKGKVVYIDLWGTRCAPCIEEFKHSQALKDKYSGKDLVFLYLKAPYSFDDSKEWNSMIYKHHLSGMNLSMSIDFYTNQFWNKYSKFYSEERLFGIPTYLIVNKKGKIVDYDAPRPSSGTVLFEKLDRELAN